MESKTLKIISDGTPGGTQALLPDGKNIAETATRIEIVIEPGKLVKAVLTFDNVRLDVVAESRN